MPSYYKDFSGDTIGALPSGMTQVSDGKATEWAESVETLAGAPGDKALRHHKAVNTDALVLERFYLDAAGSAITDGEVLAEVQNSVGSGSWPGVFLRGDATGNGYYVRQFNGNLFGVAMLYDNGATATGLQHVTLTSWLADTPYMVRARVDGTRIRARVWLSADPEPATWQVDYDTAADTTKYASGSSGTGFTAGSAPAPQTVWWRQLAIATGTGTAVLAVPPEPPATPVISDPAEGALLVYAGDLLRWS